MPRHAVLTVGELGTDDLARRLARGLTLTTGPFSFRLQSALDTVRRGVALLYADFPVAPDAGYRDFHIRVKALRRWFRPQVNFYFDGSTPFKPLPLAHAFALLEWGMNWCIAGQAHHFLLLHAAVLERNGRAVILPGDPGAGKSTLAAALMLSGWRLLSDELTLIDREDGQVVPLTRPVSLKNQSIQVIRSFDSKAVFGEVAHDTHKGTVSHLRANIDSVTRMGHKARPAHIVFPRWERGADAALRPRGKADAFMRTANCSFNYSLLGRQGFELNAALIDACDCWDFGYSQLDDALRCFEELVR